MDLMGFSKAALRGARGAFSGAEPGPGLSDLGHLIDSPRYR